jgi:hypothetical protein
MSNLEGKTVLVTAAGRADGAFMFAKGPQD